MSETPERSVEESSAATSESFCPPLCTSRDISVVGIAKIAKIADGSHMIYDKPLNDKRVLKVAHF